MGGLKATVIIFIICIFVYFSSGHEDPSLPFAKAKYGEDCNKTVRCNTNSFLICQNSTCDCTRPEIMFYDPVIQSCLVLVGGKCRYPLTNGDAEIGYVPPRYRRMEEELDCVQNAWCNRSGVCMCSDGYTELSNGTCLAKRVFEESCTTDHECRQDRYLSCINGHCGCNETVSTYNNLLRQCVGKVGQPCIGMDGCVYNADCTSNPVSLPRFARRRSRQYVTMCSCNPGYVADSSGNCEVGLGGQCSSSKPCADSFKCKNGECVCKFENLQLAMIRTQTCVSLVGGPCNETVSPTGTNSTSPNFESFQCIDNANCSPINGNDTLYECQCDGGFVGNKEGTCDLAFGESCNTVSSYSSEFDRNEDGSISSWKSDLVCDRTTPLFCINGICQCESSLYEYDGTGSCLGKYGAKCRIPMTFTTEPGSANSTASSNNLCIPGSECVGGRESSSGFGKCICSSGFTLNSNRTCSNGPNP